MDPFGSTHGTFQEVPVRGIHGEVGKREADVDPAEQVDRLLHFELVLEVELRERRDRGAPRGRCEPGLMPPVADGEQVETRVLPAGEQEVVLYDLGVPG